MSAPHAAILPPGLVTARQLLDHLADPRAAVLDCRFQLDAPEVGRRDYLQAHISGAVYVHLDRDMSAPRTGRNGRHPLPDAEAIVALFCRLGISNETHVVAYDSAGGGLAAARLWWMLRYLGHERVSILDGGWQAWLTLDGPTLGGDEKRAPAKFVGTPRVDTMSDVDAVARAVATPGWLVLDARGPTRFRGEEEPIDPVAGHIPGARNRLWLDNLDAGGHLRPRDHLRAEFDRLLEEVPAGRVICYCGSGVTSAEMVFAMEQAGLPGVKLYVGSWSEWCSDPTRPVATGA